MNTYLPTNRVFVPAPVAVIDQCRGGQVDSHDRIASNVACQGLNLTVPRQPLAISTWGKTCPGSVVATAATGRSWKATKAGRPRDSVEKMASFHNSIALGLVSFTYRLITKLLVFCATLGRLLRQDGFHKVSRRSAVALSDA